MSGSTGVPKDGWLGHGLGECIKGGVGGLRAVWVGSGRCGSLLQPWCKMDTRDGVTHSGLCWLTIPAPNGSGPQPRSAQLSELPCAPSPPPLQPDFGNMRAQRDAQKNFPSSQGVNYLGGFGLLKNGGKSIFEIMGQSGVFPRDLPKWCQNGQEGFGGCPTAHGHKGHKHIHHPHNSP